MKCHSNKLSSKGYAQYSSVASCSSCASLINRFTAVSCKDTMNSYDTQNLCSLTHYKCAGENISAIIKTRMHRIRILTDVRNTLSNCVNDMTKKKSNRKIGNRCETDLALTRAQTITRTSKPRKRNAVCDVSKQSTGVVSDANVTSAMLTWAFSVVLPLE